MVTYNFKLRITGVAQGVITGIRGLCNGLGPALFGFIFYLFHVDLNDNIDEVNGSQAVTGNKTPPTSTILHRIHEVKI